MTLRAVNPATDQLIKEYPETSPAELTHILALTKQAGLQWQETSFSHRAQLMKRAASILREQAETFAKLMTLEMGKPIKESIAEVNKCAWVCEYYADNAENFLQNEVVKTDAKKSFVCFQPLGVVLAIMPWNFPFWQVFRFAAPALMAGNAGLLKHASNVPGCALAIENVFQQAGFPDYLFRSLLISSRGIDELIARPEITAVTLTGSTAAGKAVAKKAGECLKKTVLELGGSDAYIILNDADLESAVNLCVAARLVNSGQSCVAAKRFIVLEANAKLFIELFVEKMRAMKLDDPLLTETQIGPQARRDLREQLHQQVQDSIAMGAKCVLGGEIPEGVGAFYPPTVLINVKKGMPAYDEELFGPVAAIITVANEQEAIAVANDSIYGLGAAVFTQDREKGEKIAAFLQAGSCFVNAQVHSDPRLPFGGIKESGYGRELSHYGIKEFVNIKTVYIN